MRNCKHKEAYINISSDKKEREHYCESCGGNVDEIVILDKIYYQRLLGLVPAIKELTKGYRVSDIDDSIILDGDEMNELEQILDALIEEYNLRVH